MDILERETTAAPTVNFVREGIKIGIINGAIALVLMYGSYFMGIETFMMVQRIDNSLPYMILIIIFYGIKLRKTAGGYLAFKEALQFSFVAFVISSLMYAIGTYILFNLIDPSLTQVVFDRSIETTRNMLEKLGVSQDEIDAQMDKAGSGPKETGFKEVFLGLGLALVLNFVKSLLIALVIRKEKPAF